MKHALLFVLSLLTPIAHGQSFLSHDEIARRMNEVASESRLQSESVAIETESFETLFPARDIAAHVRAAHAAARDAGVQEFTDVVDLRAYDTSVKKQPNPHCTAYGLASVMENWINHYLPATPVGDDDGLSESHIFSLYGKYSVTAAVQGTLNQKVTVEKFWPEKKSNPYKGYMDHAHTALTQITALSDVNGALAALTRGNPVYVGMRVPAGMHNPGGVIGPDAGWTKGGHAVAIVGYQLDPTIQGGGYFIIKNSWGPTAGDKGYQYLNLNICRPEARPDMYCMFWEVQGVVHAAE